MYVALVFLFVALKLISVCVRSMFFIPFFWVLLKDYIFFQFSSSLAWPNEINFTILNALLPFVSPVLNLPS